MKKRLIMLFCCLSTTAVLFSGCGETSETIQSEATTQTTTGSYALFKTTDVQEYLNFLETFDETKYEIVDISPATTFSSYTTDYYVITYKTIE